MKKLAVLTLSLVSAITVLAQGKVEFNTLVASAPRVLETDGSRVFGSGWLADMFYGTPGSDPTTWTSAGLAVPFNGTDAAAGQAGLLSGPVVTLTGFNWGTTVGVQVRAWRASDGASWAAAQVAGAHASPATAPTVNVVIPPFASPEPTAPRLTGLVGHSLVVVPEPSTILLGLAGISGLLFLRRKLA